MTKKELKDILQAEVYNPQGKILYRLFSRFINPSADAIYLLRCFQYHASNNHTIRTILFKNRLLSKYGIFIERGTIIGKNLKLPHPSGIIIGKSVRIGDNCTIYQHVTIGSQNLEGSKQKLQPEIGNNCVLFAGCSVLGNIKVSNFTTVGASALLLKDTEEYSTYVGVPAKRIK